MVSELCYLKFLWDSNFEINIPESHTARHNKRMKHETYLLIYIHEFDYICVCNIFIIIIMISSDGNQFQIIQLHL